MSFLVGVGLRERCGFRGLQEDTGAPSASQALRGLREVPGATGVARGWVSRRPGSICTTEQEQFLCNLKGREDLRRPRPAGLGRPEGSGRGEAQPRPAGRAAGAGTPVLWGLAVGLSSGGAVPSSEVLLRCCS